MRKYPDDGRLRIRHIEILTMGPIPIRDAIPETDGNAFLPWSFYPAHYTGVMGGHGALNDVLRVLDLEFEAHDAPFTREEEDIHLSRVEWNTPGTPAGTGLIDEESDV
jgi:hypothetical protein